MAVIGRNGEMEKRLDYGRVQDHQGGISECVSITRISTSADDHQGEHDDKVQKFGSKVGVLVLAQPKPMEAEVSGCEVRFEEGQTAGTLPQRRIG